MSFTVNLLLVCDNGCGAEEDYGEDMLDVPFGEIELPEGWQTNYEVNDDAFAHVCKGCVEAFEEDAS